MLGTSDTWSMSRLSHRPSEPVYYIEDCRIFIPIWLTVNDFQGELGLPFLINRNKVDFQHFGSL